MPEIKEPTHSKSGKRRRRRRAPSKKFVKKAAKRGKNNENAKTRESTVLELKDNENSQSSEDAYEILDPWTKPLPMHYPVWEIVKKTVVAAHTTAYYGYVLVHPGSVSYRTKPKLFCLIEYNPETLVVKDGSRWIKTLVVKDGYRSIKTYSIDGGDLEAPIEFGDTPASKITRDRCFYDMRKWGRLWRDRAEDDQVKTIDCAFSRAEGPIVVEMDQECIKKVLKNSSAQKNGVQVGWRILMIGSTWVDPSTVVPELKDMVADVDEDSDDDDQYSITFAKTTPWSQEIKAEFIKKFLLREFWRESILSACTLTCNIFTGYLVTRTIEEYVSKVKEMAFDSGSEVALDFLGRLCFAAKDSIMSRTMLSNLDDELHSDILHGLAEKAKEYFMYKFPENLEEKEAPAICSLFARLYVLQPSTKRKFHSGRALYVWFRGVSLDFLQEIQDKIGRHWSTEYVKNKYILGITRSTSSSLMADQASFEQRGPSSMFISHAWRNQYYDLVEACKQYPNEFFFNDIIAIQQHSTKAEEQLADLQSLPVIISYSGCVLLISDMKLEPLKRIWCLFELYHCLVTTGSRLVIEFTSEGLEDESDTGLWDAAKEIEKRIANIDVSKANATVPDDKVRILNEIQCNVPGGIEMFNIQLIAALKSEWSKNIRQQWGWRMMETVGRSVRKVATLEKELVQMKVAFANLESKFEDLLTVNK